MYTCTCGGPHHAQDRLPIHRRRRRHGHRRQRQQEGQVLEPRQIIYDNSIL